MGGLIGFETSGRDESALAGAPSSIDGVVLMSFFLLALSGTAPSLIVRVLGLWSLCFPEDSVLGSAVDCSLSSEILEKALGRTEGELWTVGESGPSDKLKPKSAGQDTWNPFSLGEGKSNSASVGAAKLVCDLNDGVRAPSPRMSSSASSEMLNVDPTNELDSKLPESCLTLEYSKTSSAARSLSPKMSLIGLSLLCSEGEGTLGGKLRPADVRVATDDVSTLESLRFDERALP